MMSLWIVYQVKNFFSVKIVIKEERIILDEELEDTSLEEVVEELPERQPRYPLLYF